MVASFSFAFSRNDRIVLSSSGFCDLSCFIFLLR
jgi:hypothetical protein